MTRPTSVTVFNLMVKVLLNMINHDKNLCCLLFEH